MPELRSPRSAALVVAGLLVLTFSAGGLTGAAVFRALGAQEAAAAPAPGADERCERRRTRILDRLDLSAEQRERVDAILQRRRAELDAFWSEAGPELHAITDSTRAEIRALLTPDQRAAYDRLREERRARERERDGDRGGNRSWR